nr:enoyl-CoA hydratase/isomerase family protein [Candidatus Korarchaeota archaeon]
MTKYECILTETRGNTTIVTLNRPEKLNAINEKMLEELGTEIARISQKPEVRAVVITGAGRAFCSGADVGEMAKAATGTPMDIR